MRVPFKNKEKGSGLIEVMVALLITAIGLLGVLAAQSKGLTSNQRAEYITEAHLLATDMLNMIAAYNALNDPASQRYNNVESQTGLPTLDCSGGCSRESQFAHDHSAWSSQLQSTLPSGFGTVNYNAITELFTITIMWDAERSGATGKNCSGDTEVDLSCYVLEVQI